MTPHDLPWKWIAVAAVIAIVVIGNMLGLFRHPVNVRSMGYLDGQAAAAQTGSYSGLSEASCKALFTEFAAGDVLSRSGEEADFLDGCQEKK